MFSSFIIPILLFSISSHANAITPRQNLEISIGAWATPPPELPVCPEPLPPPPPPPEPECPPPPSPPPPPEPECPPPPPPPSPPPPPPSPPPPHPPPPPRPPPPPPSGPGKLSPELQSAVKAIEKFRQTITKDPLNITRTWKGNICADKSTYKGFLCDTTTKDNKQRIALLNFNGFRFELTPTSLTTILNGLPDLIVFHVNTNSFSGGVPKIPSLFELDLSNNKLTGAFPPAALAANLTFLDLRFNSLTGELPPQAFALDLDVLYLNNNRFTGTIPENLGQTPALYITLANNQLTGMIPKSIGRAHALQEILLLGNRLSGCLPYEIGMLRNATIFDASKNSITGPIPHSFGCLEKIQLLNFAENKIYGAVPEPLCKLGSLHKLTLNFNYITQVGPACRKLIESGKLDVSMNCIVGVPRQRSEKECAAFFMKQQSSCPDPESFNKIPCKLDYSKKSRKLLMAQPRSYAALNKHT